MSARINPATEVLHLPDQDQGRFQNYKEIDGYGFSWRVLAVAGFGFLADSYCIFSIQTVLPWIAFIYQGDGVFSSRDELTVNTVLLVGTIFGQLLFGILADSFGRLEAYGWDLMLVISAALLLAQSSTGASNSMSIMGWICFWSFFVGVGTGAGRTLSAVITAEFAPVQSRARMIAGVFLMQPLSRLTASAMCLLILETFGKSRGLALETNQEIARVALDSMWRFVIGMGSVLAFIALILRFATSESPRFTFDINNNRLPSEQSLYSGIKRYFSTQGNWRYLAGISACSLLFETVYSGLGANNPQALARIWGSLPLTNSTSYSLDWGDSVQSDTLVSQILIRDSIHSIIAVSAGSLVGSIALVVIIDYISRRRLFLWCFLSLAFLFAITGGCFFNTSHINLQALHITLYILTQILSNLGPNALTFIISAEIFPTRYRSTLYSISTSFGTFGTLVIHIITSYTGIDNLGTLSLRLMLIVFSTFMFCGAIIAWAWIPEVQDLRRGRRLRLSSKTLEVLSERIGAERGRRLD